MVASSLEVRGASGSIRKVNSEPTSEKGGEGGMVRYFISRVGASSVQRDGESVHEYYKNRLLVVGNWSTL